MRVGVFIDGQNITIGARYAFGTGNMHPLLLGRAIAGDCDLVEIRYATGIPDNDIDPGPFIREDTQKEINREAKELRARGKWEAIAHALDAPLRNLRQHSVRRRDDRLRQSDATAWRLRATTTRTSMRSRGAE